MYSCKWDIDIYKPIKYNQLVPAYITTGGTNNSLIHPFTPIGERPFSQKDTAIVKVDTTSAVQPFANGYVKPTDRFDSLVVYVFEGGKIPQKIRNTKESKLLPELDGLKWEKDYEYVLNCDEEIGKVYGHRIFFLRLKGKTTRFKSTIKGQNVWRFSYTFWIEDLQTFINFNEINDRNNVRLGSTRNFFATPPTQFNVSITNNTLVFVQNSVNVIYRSYTPNNQIDYIRLIPTSQALKLRFIMRYVYSQGRLATLRDGTYFITNIQSKHKFCVIRNHYFNISFNQYQKITSSLFKVGGGGGNYPPPVNECDCE
jgi:hypothetical protein